MLISVIGTGYVGLVSGVGLADFGHTVTCTDIDGEKIKSLQRGIIPIYEPGLSAYFDKNVREGRLTFSSSPPETLEKCDVIIIAVGTPSRDDGCCDLQALFAAVETIGSKGPDGKVVVIKSTVPVGTNRKVQNILRERYNLTETLVVSNPEFLREGKAVHDFFHPDKVVVGTDSPRAREVMEEMYRPLYLIDTPFVFCSFETAELVKYANNAFLATKITFINQVANLADAVGADVHTIAKAMGMDGRISPKFLHPGPGFGGSCFPKDVRALVQTGREHNLDMSLAREVLSANLAQSAFMATKLERLLGNLTGKTVAALGLAFKAETDDVRESPAIAVIEYLIERGVNVRAHDPQAIETARKILGERVTYHEDLYQAMEGADALIILTEWNTYRVLHVERVKDALRGNVILDTRNVLDPAAVQAAGLVYEGVGRSFKGSE